MNATLFSPVTGVCSPAGSEELSGPPLLLAPSCSSNPWRDGAVRPTCHLPKCAVAYPRSLSSSAIVVSASGSSVLVRGGISLVLPALPSRRPSLTKVMSSCAGVLPVRSAARLGVHRGDAA